MRHAGIFLIVFFLGASTLVHPAQKPHTITFGKWTKVKLPEPDGTQTMEIKIRSLNVDGHLREYVLGSFHEVTERIFVARRAFRINDDLPEENSTTIHWLWQRGGWILVDRFNGHISPVNFSGFDTYYSDGEWYRDYFAYCSLSEDGKKLFAVVAELGRRKPVLKQELADFKGGEDPGSACAPPVWRRQPARVTFAGPSGQKLSFTLRGQVAGEISIATDDDDEDSN
jgi:hypothetical protein